MPDVFVSYSRRDFEFVKKLVDALKQTGKDPWFDQLKEPLSGIMAGAPWWEEIKYGIETAENFLFVISPNSIKSPYCHAEISYALDHGKRLVPVLYCGWIGEGETRKTIDMAIESIPEDEQIPSTVTSKTLNLKKLVRENWLVISEIQYVVFSSDNALEQSIEQLVAALDLDLAWVKMYSQLVQAAKLWESSNFDKDFLWGLNRLKPVYEMIDRREPELDELTKAFIRPEAERLLGEIDDLGTSHQRRSAIGERLSVIGDPRAGVGLREDGLPDITWCEVPGGKVEIRGERFVVQPFYISKYLITYVQFQAFLDAEDGFDSDEWWDDWPREQIKQEMAEQRNKYASYPRDTISCYQAVAFSRWIDSKYRLANTLPKPLVTATKIREPMDMPFEGEHKRVDMWSIRLPSEWEWQQAATGGDPSRIYPWGTEWNDGQHCNSSEAGIGRATAVGMYPHGVSPVGALDMGGNVHEWCINDYGNLYVYTHSLEARSLRGGDFSSTTQNVCCLARTGNRPNYRGNSFSFRLVYAKTTDIFGRYTV